MARHLYNGGVMHDTIGESIIAMTKELKTLKEFANYVKKQGLINADCLFTNLLNVSCALPTLSS